MWNVNDNSIDILGKVTILLMSGLKMTEISGESNFRMQSVSCTCRPTREECVCYCWVTDHTLEVESWATGEMINDMDRI